MARGESRASSSSSPSLFYIPETILIQILVRLPVKSLLQFRSACKSWLSLITNRSFVEAHLKHHTSSDNSNSHILLRYIPAQNKYNFWRYTIRYDDESFGQYFQPEVPLRFNSLDIYGSFNGLVCLSTKSSNTIYLWNPALGRYKTLQKPQGVDAPTLGGDSTFQNIGSTPFLAFGLDYHCHDYKVVKIVDYLLRRYTDGTHSYKSWFIVDVYSLSTDSWRRISVASPSGYSCFCQPVIMNGAVYGIGRGNTLLQFEMDDEVFREMKLPSGAQHGQCEPQIAVSGESLYLYKFGESKSNGCDIWILTMKYSKLGTWTKRFNFNFPDLNWSTIGFRRNGEIMQLNCRHRLASYNRENQQAKDLGIHGRQITSHSYVESLALLGDKDCYSIQ